MSTLKRKKLSLTQDELMVLYYVSGVGEDGDPLKNIYELEQDEDYELEDAYASLEKLHKKVRALKWEKETE